MPNTPFSVIFLDKGLYTVNNHQHLKIDLPSCKLKRSLQGEWVKVDMMFNNLLHKGKTLAMKATMKVFVTTDPKIYSGVDGFVGILPIHESFHEYSFFDQLELFMK